MNHSIVRARVHLEDDNMISQKLRTAFTKGYHWLANNFVLGNESGLVVSWWDIIVLTIFTMLVFMFLGPVMDNIYAYINGTVNNPLSVNFYTDSDMKTVNDLYNVFKWIPYLAFGVVVFYAINYSNLKKGGE